MLRSIIQLLCNCKYNNFYIENKAILYLQEQNFGKLILLKRNKKLIGYTGFEEYNSWEYKNNQFNTARIKVTRTEELKDILSIDGVSGVDIYVKKNKRKKGHGYRLLETLVEEVIKEDYDQLVIQDVLEECEIFYEKSLNKLLQENKITDYKKIVKNKPGILDKYEIII